VLIFDVLDDWVPATGKLVQWASCVLRYLPSVVVDLISVTWCINNVQSQAHTIFFDDMRHSLNLGGRSDRFIRSHSPFRINEVRSEDRVYEGGFSKTSLT